MFKKYSGSSSRSSTDVFFFKNFSKIFVGVAPRNFDDLSKAIPEVPPKIRLEIPSKNFPEVSLEILKKVPPGRAPEVPSEIYS